MLRKWSVFTMLRRPKESTVALLQSIFEDTRHKESKILIVQPIEQREFSNWGMRLMFLERWLWSPETKKQANNLSRFLPFKPSQWNREETEEFLHAIQQIETPPHVQESGISLKCLRKYDSACGWTAPNLYLWCKASWLFWSSWLYYLLV